MRHRRSSVNKAVTGTAPRVTAAEVINPPALSTLSGNGIRTVPTYSSTSDYRAESATTQRARVDTSRMLQEEVPLMGYLIRSLAQEAIGDGLSPASESKDAEFAKRSVELFELWGRTPAIDVRRRFDFWTAQTMLAMTAMGDGEIFALKIRSNDSLALSKKLTDKTFRRLQLQFLTRDKIGNGTARQGRVNQSDYRWNNGIKFDGLDRPVEYRVVRKNGTLSSQAETVAYTPDQILHIYDDKSFDQDHGTPWLFRAHKSALDGMDMEALRKFAAKVRASFLGAIHTKDGTLPGALRGLARKGTQIGEDGSTVEDNGMRYIELSSGVSVPVFKESEGLTFFNGGEPVNFPELFRALWGNMVMGTGAPPEYILNLAGLGSAATRLVINKVKHALNAIRRMIRDQYCQKVWEFVIGDAILRGELSAPDDWTHVTWLGGGLDPSIDTGRDERNEQVKLLNGTGTLANYAAAFGKTGTEIQQARNLELLEGIKHGMEAAKTLLPEVPIPYTLFLPAQHVQMMSGTLTPEPAPEPPANADAANDPPGTA